MIGCFNRSVLLTYFGVLSALAGIALLFAGVSESYALICLIVAGVCDLFDGRIARKCRRNDTQKRFGEQIDSLCDTVSFLILPATLLLAGSEHPLPAALAAGFYLICGINRLAWFNVRIQDFRESYQGLPVTYAAVILPIAFAAARELPGIRPSLPLLYLLLGLLFILNFRIPKPRGIWYILFALLAAGMILFFLLRPDP